MLVSAQNGKKRICESLTHTVQYFLEHTNISLINNEVTVKVTPCIRNTKLGRSLVSGCGNIATTSALATTGKVPNI